MHALEQYNGIFKEIFLVDDDTLNESFTFADVEAWDSMTHMELIAALEETFDLMLDTNDILNYGSYENGKAILRRNGVEI